MRKTGEAQRKQGRPMQPVDGQQKEEPPMQPVDGQQKEELQMRQGEAQRTGAGQAQPARQMLSPPAESRR